jgi:rhomboid protease GluP
MNLEGRPSLCRSCGAIVGSGQTSCAVCGADLAAAAVRNSRPRASFNGDAMRFARAVLNRSYLFTILFLVANFFVFLLMWQSSGMKSAALASFPDPVLLAYGAKLNFLIKQNREWWRFVTPIFIHVNLLHLLVNMYSLWMIGPYVEKLYGSAKFVFFWVVTGVAGVAASYLTVQPQLAHGLPGTFIFKAGDGPSAGASGALFGLVGVLFVFGIRFRRELPEGFKRAFGTGLLPVIVINLFIGFVGRGFIDNAAHLGGLASGAALGLVIDYKRPGERTTITITWRILQILALALLAISFAMVARNFNRQLIASQQSGLPVLSIGKEAQAVESYLTALNEGQRAFNTAITIKPDAVAIDHAMELLNQATGPDETAEQLRIEMKSLLERARGLPPPDNKNRPSAESAVQTKKLFQDFQTWIKTRDEWIKNKGGQYHIELVAPAAATDASDQEGPASSPTATPGTVRAR